MPVAVRIARYGDGFNLYAEMNKTMVFFAAVAVAVPLLADDLLDEVLYWDKPPTKSKTEKVSEAREVSPWEQDETVSEPEPGDGQQRWRSENAERRGATVGNALPFSSAEYWRTGDKVQNDAREEDGMLNAAEMERNVRLMLRGGGGADAVLGGGELMWPLWKSSFDVSIRYFNVEKKYTRMRSYEETYYSWSRESYAFPYIGHKHSRTIYYTGEESLKNYGAEAQVLWRPFRGQLLSPYVGAGGNLSDDNGGSRLSWRLGTSLNVWRVWVNGEYTGRQSVTEFAASLGCRLGYHIALLVFYEQFRGNGSDGERTKGKIGGGGLTWVF